MFKIGDNVIYDGKIYDIFWIYDNGRCELIDRNSSVATPILVHVDNLEKT